MERETEASFGTPAGRIPSAFVPLFCVPVGVLFVSVAAPAVGGTGAAAPIRGARSGAGKGPA